MQIRRIVIGNICELNSETISSSNSPEIIRYLDTSSITKNIIECFQLLDSRQTLFPSRAKRKVKNGTIIYSTVRPNLEHFGYLVNPEENLIVSTGFLTIDVIDKDIDFKFLYYAITQKHITDYLHTIAVNNVSSYPSINPSDIGNLELKIPRDKTVQRRIASVLSSLDSKIETNNRINSELEAMAKTLYDYWFVQFDFPNAEGKPYNISCGKMVWNKELKRDIPEGWEVYKVGDLLYTSLGGTPSTTVKAYWENGNINWLNSGEIANFPIIASELKVTEAATRNSATEIMPKGSVMLSITRHLRPSILGIDACANQSVVGIKEKGDIKCYYLYPYLKNEVTRLNAMRSGAQQPHINKEIVDESFILIPNECSNILKTYNSEVGHLYELIINKALQNQQLAALRDWLLPMLMNGQVTVGSSAENKASYEIEEEIRLAAEPIVEK